MKLEIEIIKTTASQKQGLHQLYEAIKKHLASHFINEKKYWLLAEKAWKLIQEKRMKGMSKIELAENIKNADATTFNLYRFAKQFY